MVWLPPKGLEKLKSIACNRGLWEDLGNGYITKRPKKKRASAQVTAEFPGEGVLISFNMRTISINTALDGGAFDIRAAANRVERLGHSPVAIRDSSSSESL